jgi:hypothetical protein
MLRGPPRVASGQRSCRQAVQEHGESNRDEDRGEDLLLVGSVPSALMSSTAKTIGASPRGPNHPRKATVGARARVPSIAIATASIRTIVRLSTAYPATAHVTASRLGSSNTAPKTMNVAASSSVPICSARSLAAFVSLQAFSGGRMRGWRRPMRRSQRALTPQAFEGF